MQPKVGGIPGVTAGYGKLDRPNGVEISLLEQCIRKGTEFVFMFYENASAKRKEHFFINKDVANISIFITSKDTLLVIKIFTNNKILCGFLLLHRIAKSHAD